MAISNLLSGRVRLKGPKNVTSDRYEFVDLSQVEPNLGVPNFSASLSGGVAIVVSDSDGNRGFVQNLVLNQITSSFKGTADLTGSFVGSGFLTGSFTGSFAGDGSQLVNVPSVTSPRIASGSATASISPNKGLEVNTFVGISGDLYVTGSERITGNLYVDNSIYAQQLLVSFISSSVIYSSGSNKFGDEPTDKQEFTG